MANADIKSKLERISARFGDLEVDQCETYNARDLARAFTQAVNDHNTFASNQEHIVSQITSSMNKITSSMNEITSDLRRVSALLKRTTSEVEDHREYIGIITKAVKELRAKHADLESTTKKAATTIYERRALQLFCKVHDQR